MRKRWNEFKKSIPPFFSWTYVNSVIVAVLIAIMFGNAFVNFSVFNPVKRCFDDFSMTDVYYQITNSETNKNISDKIVILDITKQYKRGDIAKTINEVSAQNPSLVVLDVIFEGIKDDFAGNDSLIEAVLRTRNLIADSKLIDYDVKKDCFNGICSSFFQTGIDIPYGYGNLVDNMEKCTIRKYSMAENLENRQIYSLSTLTAYTYLKEKPVFAGHGVKSIDFTPMIFPIVSCDSIAENKELLKNKIVIIGTSYEEADMHYTPLGKMSGVNLQAYMVQTQLNHTETTDMSTWVSMLWGVIMCYMTIFINTWIRRSSFHLRSLATNFVDFLLMTFWGWLGFYCYNRFDYNINLLYPLAGIGLAGTGLYWVNVVSMGRRGLRIHREKLKKTTQEDE